MKEFDVVIAGGAMTGASLALALDHLSNGRLTIAVVEPHQLDQHQHSGFDGRSIALSFGTVQQLQRFNLWQNLAEFATPITHINISDRHHSGLLAVNSELFHLDVLGYVIELADVGRVYNHQMKQCSAITYFCPYCVETMERNKEHVDVQLSNKQLIRTKLMVAADGALSTSCNQIGLPLDEHELGQTAIIANVMTEKAPNGQAFERFTADGSIALLPMSGGRMSLVWCVPPSKAGILLALSDAEFLTYLQDIFGWRLGRLTQVSTRSSYPLILRYRKQIVSHRFVAVGNAAQSIHPIAGQGFNLGIRDIACLVEMLINRMDDIGHYPTLHSFASARESDRNATIALTSSLISLFSNDHTTLSIGRNIGLMFLNNFPQIAPSFWHRMLGIVS